jgi:S1-C subfamily serine protease
VKKDYAEAVEWYRKSAEQGDAFAQYNLAEAYADGKGVIRDQKAAIQWYATAAEQGNIFAQYRLGVKYHWGEGVPKNLIAAAGWYRRAAIGGYEPAQFILARMYDNGEGLPLNPVEAAKWYRKAAEQGSVSAQNNLGTMYASGSGVPKDEIEALAWFNISAAAGDKTTIKNRSECERNLGRELTLIAQQRSKEILKEIALRKQMAANAAKAASPPLKSRTTVVGSGAIISPSGYVLTAAHVLGHSAVVSVVMVNDHKTARLVRLDDANDIALLKIDGGPYSALPLVPSGAVRLGQAVATIGFPNVEIQGFSPKVTRGEISSLNGVGDDPRSWQVSVPVQPGNSGGPLLDENGNLIGVVLAKLGLEAAKATQDLPQNVGYALKSAYIVPLLESLVNDLPPAHQGVKKPSFEEMVAIAREATVLIVNDGESVPPSPK